MDIHVKIRAMFGDRSDTVDTTISLIVSVCARIWARIRGHWGAALASLLEELDSVLAKPDRCDFMNAIYVDKHMAKSNVSWLFVNFSTAKKVLQMIGSGDA